METFIIALLYVAAGLLGFALSVARRFRPLLLSYSAFSCAIGLWTLSVSSARGLIYPGSWRSVELTAFYGMPLALALFFAMLFGGGYKDLLRRLWQYYAVLVTGSLLYILLPGGRLESLLPIYQISLLVSIPIWMLVLIPTIRKDRENLSVIVGATIMGITGVTDLLSAMGLFAANVHVVHFGILAFFIALSARLLGSILEFEQREALLRKVAAGTTGTGEEFFRAMVRELAGAFSAKYAIVGELIGAKQEVQTLAVWSRNQLVGNFRYKVVEIPWKELGAQPTITHFGIMLTDRDQNQIGVLTLLHDQPLQKAGYARTMLEIFAARAASEIQRTQAEQQIRYLGHHDMLTGLPNRVLFADRLEHAITVADTQQVSFALLFLDIDHFKKINDSLGHHHGDLVLKRVTELLRDCVSPIDTVSRRSGDEFILLLSGQTNPDDAAHIARKICESIAQPLMIDGVRITTSASIGIAIYPRDGLTPDILLKNSDIAMYHAKENGRNQFQFYSAELNRVTHERIEMERALRDAIYLNQLEVHYQPQLDFRTGKADACEALIRWRHPIWGNIPPERFIPIAEESGQILEIGKWVLEEVAQRFADLDAVSLGHVRISVNVSARQLQHEQFCQGIEETIQKFKFDARRLELEVTESMLMEDTEKAILAIKHLSDLGIKFSIDDFGIGYSSLSYLRQLKIHYLKIDKSFVRDVTVDTDNASIVRAIISLAHSLRLNVIAEGVETNEQRDFLQLHACDLMQGYWWAKPMPFTELLSFLARATYIPQTIDSGRKDQAPFV